MQWEKRTDGWLHMRNSCDAYMIWEYQRTKQCSTSHDPVAGQIHVHVFSQHTLEMCIDYSKLDFVLQATMALSWILQRLPAVPVHQIPHCLRQQACCYWTHAIPTAVTMHRDHRYGNSTQSARSREPPRHRHHSRLHERMNHAHQDLMHGKMTRMMTVTTTAYKNSYCHSGRTHTTLVRRLATVWVPHIRL